MPDTGTRDPATAVREFVVRTGFGVPPPAIPALITMPVQERVRLLASGELDMAHWLSVADEWGFAADARYRASVDLRPTTTAVRVGVKDTIDVAGFPTRLGLRRHRHHPARSAAPLAALARSGGSATVNAKVVTTELNLGLGSGCGNPYFPHIDPAGSSTGSGVSVAAGVCDLSLGTDVLGSARWPAGRCGVVGLRTTHDERQLGGVFPLSPSMDAAGWLARTAEDLEYFWSWICGSAPVARSLTGRSRIGVVREVLDGDPDPEIRAALMRAADGLVRAGHKVRPVAIGRAWQHRGFAWELCAREAWDGNQVWRQWIDDDLSESTRLALEAGRAVSDARYAELRAAQAADRAEVPEWFAAERIDAWLLPLDPDVPRARDASPPAKTIPTGDQGDYDREIGYTPVASFLGLPAITLPVGRSAADAPLAMQLVGPPHSETSLIALARDLATSVGDLKLLPR